MHSNDKHAEAIAASTYEAQQELAELPTTTLPIYGKLRTVRIHGQPNGESDLWLGHLVDTDLMISIPVDAGDRSDELPDRMIVAIYSAAGIAHVIATGKPAFVFRGSQAIEMLMPSVSVVPLC